MLMTSTPMVHYYCHICEAEVDANLQDYTCSHCNSGFIEELPSHSTNLSDLEAPTSSEFNLLSTLFSDLVQGTSVVLDEPDDETLYREYQEPRTRRSRRSNHNRQGNASERITIRFPLQPNAVATRIRLSDLGNPFLLNILSGFDSVQGDIRNYALTQGMFDDLLAFLSNQLQFGPPPATDEEITNLPTVDLTDDLVHQFKTCSICFDDFQPGERVTRLPCQHVYHPSCVSTWLRQHATCPICRKDLHGRDTSQIDGPPDSRPPGAPGPSTP